MLRDVSAPFSNALKVRPKVDIEGLLCWKLLTFHRGKKWFLSFSFVPCAPKNGAFLNLLARKKAPQDWTQQHIYMYIYICCCICCCVRKWGAFLRFNRSIMLPFMRSKMGCAEPGAWNPYFYSVSGGRTSYSRGCVGHHAENEVVQNTVLLFIYGIFFWVG